MKFENSTPLVQRLLDTHACPSSVEASQLRQNLSDERCKLLQLDEEIDRLKLTLQTLSIRRDDTQESVDLHVCVLSPIRRIPGEVLSEIFLEALIHDRRSTSDYSPPVTLNTRKGPWVFGRVCRFWRKTALNLPKMWSDVEIDSEDAREPEHTLALVARELMRRSKKSPITLSVHPLPGRRLPKILDSLVPHCHRWKEARFYFPYQYLPKLVSIKGRIPLLKVLHLHLDEPRSLPSTWSIFDMFSTAPALRILYLAFHPNAPWTFPWSQLTRYDGQQAIPGQHLDILGQLDKARKIILCDGMGCELTLRLPTRSIIRPTIRSAKEQLGSGGFGDATVFRHLTLPSLAKLDIHWVDGTSTQISAMIIRSSCLLKTLTISASNMDDALVELLRSTPSLTNLVLYEEATYHPSLLRHLIIRNSLDASFLPVLESVSIESEMCGGQEYPEADLFIQILESRWSSPRRGDSTVVALKRFWFFCTVPEDSDFSEAVYDKFANFRNEGLDITIDIL